MHFGPIAIIILLVVFACIGGAHHRDKTVANNPAAAIAKPVDQMPSKGGLFIPIVLALAVLVFFASSLFTQVPHAIK